MTWMDRIGRIGAGDGRGLRIILVKWDSLRAWRHCGTAIWDRERVQRDSLGQAFGRSATGIGGLATGIGGLGWWL